jgi:hypothetical protein
LLIFFHEGHSFVLRSKIVRQVGQYVVVSWHIVWSAAEDLGVGEVVWMRVVRSGRGKGNEDGIYGFSLFARKLLFSLHRKMGYLVLSTATHANGLIICGPRQPEEQKDCCSEVLSSA